MKTDPRHLHPRVHGDRGIAALLAVAWLVPSVLAQDATPDRLGAPPAVDPSAEAAPPAQAPARQPPVTIRLNLERTTERGLIDFFAAGLGCQAVVPEGLSDEASDEGRIEWCDPRFHAADEALVLADAVLRTRGLAVSRRDGLLVVEQLATATRPVDGQWTRVVPLVTTDGPAFVDSLRPVLRDACTIATIGQAGSASLVVTAAAASELSRVEQLVNALDRADVSGEVVSVNLSHVRAADARDALLRMLGTDGAIAGVALADDGSGRTSSPSRPGM